MTQESRTTLYESPSPDRKVEVGAVSWSNKLLVTHPVCYVTSIGVVDGKKICGVSPFASILDISYGTTGNGLPQVMIGIATEAHSVVGEHKDEDKGEPNTMVNIRENPFFIVNIPGEDLIEGVMDEIARPLRRDMYYDKIDRAGLTKLEPFRLTDQAKYDELNARFGLNLTRPDIYPPILGECLAHLECVVFPKNIWLPTGSDHYVVVGTVIGASYDTRLGRNINEARDTKEAKEILNQVRDTLVGKVFDHFGGRTDEGGTIVRDYANHTRFPRPTKLIYEAEAYKGK